MGSPLDERGRNERDWPPHQVTITNDFYLGKHEITQAQWQAVMGSNPSYYYGNNNPVDNVSWYDCQEFIAILNQMGLGTFRMPTEAEWEYACRAGSTTRFFFGDALGCADEEIIYCELMDQYMWWGGNSYYGRNVHGTKEVRLNGTKEVGLKLPNPWGLFDMHGNLREHCSDWYQDPYARGETVDPIGKETGTHRIQRGGNGNDTTKNCRSALRANINPYQTGGLRVAKTP